MRNDWISVRLGCALEAGAVKLPMHTTGRLIARDMHLRTEWLLRLLTRL